METYSDFIMTRLRQRLDLDEDNTSKDEQIMQMSFYDVLDEFLIWEGIIGYTSVIVMVIKELCREGWIEFEKGED